MSCCDWSEFPLQWRHNESDGVSNHRCHECLLSSVFRRRSKKTSQLRFTGFCEGSSPVTGGPVVRKMFSFDDVIMPTVFIDSQSDNPLHGGSGFRLVCAKRLWNRGGRSNHVTEWVIKRLWRPQYASNGVSAVLHCKIDTWAYRL